MKPGSQPSEGETQPVPLRDSEPYDSVYDVGAYDYELPEALIAQAPLPARDASRLLVVDRAQGSLEDATLDGFELRFDPGDIFVFNDTRVLKARVEAVRADTGGRAEVLVLSVGDGDATVMLGTRGTPQPGEVIRTQTPADDPLALTLVHALGDGLWSVASGRAGHALLAWLDRNGRVPLPPYVKRARGSDPRDGEDAVRYQTLVARHDGAVAAPTAGLHFSHDVLRRLEERGVARTAVTLHVGPGTFRPVTANDLRDHAMHSERFEVSAACVDAIRGARARGRRVVAVGTTVVRALEAASENGGLRPAASATSIFLHPPRRLEAFDVLFTNFHAPRSTLLMLTAAFAGRDLLLRAYRHAVAGAYRLLSFGDAMMIS